ncbi:MAG: GNAT family N-acetyltransferase [Chloroflexota bacterium]
MDDIITVIESEDRRRADQFLDSAWREYHASRNDDPGIDWHSEPVFLIASSAGGGIAGVAKGRVVAGVGHLSDLMVTPAERGRGVGSGLLGAFEEHCRAARCHKLTVHTEEHSDAHRFYLARGWRQEARFVNDKGQQDFVRLVKFPSSTPTCK